MDAKVSQPSGHRNQFPSSREFSGFIMSQYRAGVKVKDRVKVRQLRATAADLLEYFRASVEQRVRFLKLFFARLKFLNSSV